MSVLADLTSTLTSALSNLPPPDKIQDAERMQLLEVVSQLQAAIEPPHLPIQRFCFSVSSSSGLVVQPMLFATNIKPWVALRHCCDSDSSGNGDL
jgi:hypothetical protein